MRRLTTEFDTAHWTSQHLTSDKNLTCRGFAPAAECLSEFWPAAGTSQASHLSSFRLFRFAYTALWILYTATPIAKVEVMGRGLLADREVIPQATKVNPSLFKLIYADLLNTKKTQKTVQTALEAIEDYVARRASSLFRPVLDHLREAGEARSCIEIDEHFKRNFGIEGVTLASEYLADQKITHLAKKSNIEVQELAFVHFVHREKARNAF